MTRSYNKITPAAKAKKIRLFDRPVQTVLFHPDHQAFINDRERKTVIFAYQKPLI